MTDICRLCLVNNGSFHGLSELRENLPISVISMIICPIKIEVNDSISQKICDHCLDVILNAYQLRTISANSERILREIQNDQQVQKQQDEFQDQDTSASEFNQHDEVDDQSLSDNFVVYDPQIEDDTDSGTFNIKTSQLFEVQRDTKSSYHVDCADADAKKKSMVWNYFGHLKYNQNLVEAERSYNFCKLCVEEKQMLKFKYKIDSTATSVLFNHLKKHHGLSKEDLSVILNDKKPPSDMTACPVCNQTFNLNALELHMILEHENGEETRTRELVSNCRVNCFKKSAKNKSIVWDYFGMLIDKGVIADEYHYYCRLCVEEKNDFHTKYTKNTSTTILMVHLKSAHTSKNQQESMEKSTPTESYESQQSKRIKLSEDFPCKSCSEKFESKNALTRHLYQDHEDQLKKFYCDYENCNKSFTLKDTLSKHIKASHEGASKFPCNQCPTTLSTKMSLQRHINTCHLKLKTYVCETCSAAFSEAKSLKYHERKVHMGIDDKKLQCETCNMKFLTQWQLNRHQLTHTREVRSLMNFETVTI